MSLKQLSSAKIFFSRCSPSRIEKYIERRRIKPSTALEYVMPSNIKITSVQLKLDGGMTLIDFLSSICGVISKAVSDGSQLVCLPEYTGLLLLLTSRSLYEEVYHFSDDLISDRSDAVEKAAAFYSSHLSHKLYDCYQKLFSLLASSHKIYIQAGTCLVKTRDGLFNRAVLFGPDGKIVMEQDKIHLNEYEKNLGLSPGLHINVGECKLGKLAILPGRDQQVFETAKVARSLGALILLCPSGLRGGVGSSFFQSCAFMRSQEQQVFSVSSWLTGDFMDLPFRAISGIYSPFSASKLGNGIIIQSETPASGACLTARIDLDRLGKDADSYKSDLNPHIDELLKMQYTHPRQAPVPLSPDDDTEDEDELGSTAPD